MSLCDNCVNKGSFKLSKCRGDDTSMILVASCPCFYSKWANLDDTPIVEGKRWDEAFEELIEMLEEAKTTGKPVIIFLPGEEEWNELKARELKGLRLIEVGEE